MRFGARVLLVLLSAVGVLGGAACSSESSGSGCVAQELKVEPASVRVGGYVSVNGSGFVHCRDTSSNDEPMPTDDPLTDLQVSIVQAGRSVVLGTVDASGEMGDLTVRATVPATLKPGDAQIVVTGTPATADLKLR